MRNFGHLKACRATNRELPEQCPIMVSRHLAQVSPHLMPAATASAEVQTVGQRTSNIEEVCGGPPSGHGNGITLANVPFARDLSSYLQSLASILQLPSFSQWLPQLQHRRKAAAHAVVFHPRLTCLRQAWKGNSKGCFREGFTHTL